MIKNSGKHCSVNQKDHLPFTVAIAKPQLITELKGVLLAKLQQGFQKGTVGQFLYFWPHWYREVEISE